MTGHTELLVDAVELGSEVDVAPAAVVVEVFEDTGAVVVADPPFVEPAIGVLVLVTAVVAAAAVLGLVAVVLGTVAPVVPGVVVPVVLEVGVAPVAATLVNAFAAGPLEAAELWPDATLVEVLEVADPAEIGLGAIAVLGTLALVEVAPAIAVEVPLACVAPPALVDVAETPVVPGVDLPTTVIGSVIVVGEVVVPRVATGVLAEPTAGATWASEVCQPTLVKAELTAGTVLKRHRTSSPSRSSGRTTCKLRRRG